MGGFMNALRVQKIFRFSNDFLAPLLVALSVLLILPQAFAQHPWPWSEHIPAFWEMQEADVQAHVKKSIQKFNQEIEEIVQTPKEKRNFENTLLRFDRARFRLMNETSFLQVMALNDQREDFRQLAFQLDKGVFETLTKVYYRNDLFAVLKDGTPVAEPQAQLKNRILREFEESGAHLDSSVQQRDTQIRSMIHGFIREFRQNLQSKKNSLYLSKSDLQGAPESVLDRMEQNQQGSFILTPDMMETGRDLLKYVVNPSVRQKIYELLGTAGGQENLRLASQILDLRKERAHIHREISWVHSQVRHQMLRTPEAVEIFLNRVKSTISPTYLQERKDLQALYDRFYTSAQGFSDQYQQWDILFLTQKYLQNTMELDEENLRPYFEASRVVKETLKIFSELYGVEFHQEKSIKTWSPDVVAFSVQLKNKSQAILYLDLFRRPGKALGSFSKITNYHWVAKDRSVSRQPSTDTGKTVVLVHTNMTQAQDGQPHLLSFEDIQESLFHELGHAMHLIVTRAPYPGLSADRVPSDFIEVPAQLMERVAASKEMITRLGSHYETTKTIPEVEVQKLMDKGSVFLAQRWMGRLVQDVFDYRIHSSSDPGQGILDAYRATVKDVTGFESADADWTPARLGHLYSGYDGKMYSFLWASVIVENIAQQLITPQGTWDRSRFQEYTKTLLARAGSEDTSLVLQNFLGKGVSFQPVRDVFHKDSKNISASVSNKSSVSCDQIFKH